MSLTPPLLDDLTPLEQQVVDAALRGTWITPNTVLPMDELETTDDPDVRVRAELIRELLVGRRGELDPRGLRIRRVRVVGLLDLDHVKAVAGLALFECVLRDGVTCVRARLREVNLSSSQMSMLHADGLHTDGRMALADVSVTGSNKFGALQLPGAHVGGQLDLEHTKITNDSGPALAAENLRTDDHMSLQGATLIGTSTRAAVQLLGADIGGHLMFDRAEVTNDAVAADNLRTGGQMSMQSATMTGAGCHGAMRLAGAHVGGQLVLDHTEFANHIGAALNAYNLRIDGHMSLRGTTLTGAGELGAMRLVGAHIGGQVWLDGIQVDNELGRLIGMNDAQVTGVLSLPVSTVCPHAHTDIGRSECPDSQRWIAVEGLTFPRLAGVSWRHWLHLLMHHTSTYVPQPYQQLAAVERAAGHDNNARQILIAQQDDLRRRTPEALGGWLTQRRHRLWGWLGRYGYRAHRLVLALAFVLALAAGLGYVAGQVSTRSGHHAAERTAAADSPRTPCSTAELIGLGIDRGLPLGTTGLRARCDLDTGTRWGQAFTYAIWALQALIWALATLAIAAYTGLVRKPI